MPKRQRWRPVKGTGSRVYDPVERALLYAADLPLRLAHAVRRQAAPVLEPEHVHEILVLRLDRIGDLVMSLPALGDLRAAFPQARIRLAVGTWSEPLARSAPVDEVLVWSAPWVGRPREGAESLRALWARARALRDSRIDLAIDLQGDVRASVLLWLSGARIRVGYANTGGGSLLTHVVPLDETVSFVEQNRRAVATVGATRTAGAHDPLTPGERAGARQILAAHGVPLDACPLIGLHPSGGRLIKQWPIARWAEIARRLQEEQGATVVVTGSAADQPLFQALAQALPHPPLDLTGRLSLRETLAALSAFDLLLSPDTGPMHMAAAVGTPSVSVFGPSDPVRYFSGGSGTPGSRHEVVRHELWCAPCNLIRKPPAECQEGEAPECLRLVTVDAVYTAAQRVLGFIDSLSPAPVEGGRERRGDSGAGHGPGSSSPLDPR